MMRTPEMFINKHNAQIAGLKAVALIPEVHRFKVDYHVHRNEQGFIVRLIDVEGAHLGVLPEDWQENLVRTAEQVRAAL